MIIGLSRERKNPPDNRVALSPIQCLALQQRYPQISVIVESSPTRCFSDTAYQEVGIPVVADLQTADIILNIKELPSDSLIPNKTYFFFSHTIKKQPYNKGMLQAILSKTSHSSTTKFCATKTVSAFSVLVVSPAWWVHTTGYWYTGKNTISST